MSTSTLEEVNQGFGRLSQRFYVVSSGRTLELEAKTNDMTKEWVGAIEFLIQFTKVQEEKKKALVVKPGYILFLLFSSLLLLFRVVSFHITYANNEWYRCNIIVIRIN
jgi:hypothetical protein